MFFLSLSGLVLLSAVAASLAVPRVGRLAEALGAIDTPGGRRRHDNPIPRLGGIAIVFGVLVGLAAGLLVAVKGGGFKVDVWELSCFTAAVLTIFVLGIRDDLRETGVLTKLLAQTFAAVLVVVGAGWSFAALSLPFGGKVELGLLSTVVSILWIVGITNAINLIDGLDGLASGIVAIISGCLLLLATLKGDLPMMLAYGSILGASLGFLWHNWEPARIFMGDSGSQTLGFLLAVLAMRSSLKASTAVAILIPILALGLPAIDTLAVMMSRWRRATDSKLPARILKMFQADRSHIHFVLADVTAKRRTVVLRLYAVVAAFCAMALLVALSGRLDIGISLLAAEIVAVMLVRQIARRKLPRLEAGGAVDFPPTPAEVVLEDPPPTRASASG